MRLEIRKVASEYNSLAVEEVKGWTYSGSKPPFHLLKMLQDRGLVREVDFRFTYLPVMASKALWQLAQTSIEPISYTDYIYWSDRVGQFPVNKDDFSEIYAIEEGLPRQTNRNFNSDTLYRHVGVYQVYLQRLTDRELEV